MYGEQGTEYDIGGTVLKVDEEFILATILAMVALLKDVLPNFDETTSAVASRIYDEIKQTKPEA